VKRKGSGKDPVESHFTLCAGTCRVTTPFRTQKEIQELMTVSDVLPDYMVERLGIPENMVGDLCNDLYSKYGTTMAGV
jgi:hypothetical protein